MKKILVVDDAAVMRMRLRDILEPRYSVVAEAADGQEAINLYKEAKPDLVTLDITMPQVNGIEALEQILAVDPNAKVVIVSAVGQRQVVLQALSKGAKDFIVKPFERDRVLESIVKLLG